MWMAVAFMLAAAVVEADQCSSDDDECPSRNTANKSIVSLLQTKLRMNVLEDPLRIGFRSSTSSEEQIRSYMSALYHEELENKLEWRDKWKETEMVYSGIGHLEASDIALLDASLGSGRFVKKPPSCPMNATFLSTSQPAPSGTWVEVTRSARTYGEGKDFAGGSCWFYPLKGSGVFINIGSTAAFDGEETDAEKHMLSEYYPTSEILAEYAHAKGLDTIQLLEYRIRPELVYFGGSCRDTSITTGCIPGLELRTGLHGNLPCICKEKDVSSPDTSPSVLNCDG